MDIHISNHIHCTWKKMNELLNSIEMDCYSRDPFFLPLPSIAIQTENEFMQEDNDENLTYTTLLPLVELTPPPPEPTHHFVEPEPTRPKERNHKKKEPNPATYFNIKNVIKFNNDKTHKHKRNYSEEQYSKHLVVELLKCDDLVTKLNSNSTTLNERQFILATSGPKCLECNKKFSNMKIFKIHNKNFHKNPLVSLTKSNNKISRRRSGDENVEPTNTFPFKEVSNTAVSINQSISKKHCR